MPLYPPNPMPRSITDRIEHDFQWFGKHTPENREQMDALRAHFKSFALQIVNNTPEGREQSLAVTHIEEAMMWAIASIARLGESGGA
jgi:hypothetical protein